MTQPDSAFSDIDRAHMKRALVLAAQGLYTTDPNPRVGCVLAHGATVVGEGFHARAGEGHAEVHALQMAGSHARGATAYVTLEPCNHHGRTPPCSEALIAAGVAHVVYALRDPNPRVDGAGERRLRAAGISVAGGLMSDESQQLNCGFVKRMSTGMPFVRVKLAMNAATPLNNSPALPARGAPDHFRGESRLPLHHHEFPQPLGADLSVHRQL